MEAPRPQQKPTLEKILQRGDIWQGYKQAYGGQRSIDTGHNNLNEQLVNGGWPVASLIEIHMHNASAGEWRLLAPALKHCLSNSNNHAVLLNPPALPFAQGLSQMGIALERLLIIQINNKADFIACFVELAHAISCSMLMAWQPKQSLSYSELRKCQLATASGNGLYLLFRTYAHNRSKNQAKNHYQKQQLQAQQQSSPAALRLQAILEQQNLRINLLKQRGQLKQSSHPILISLPKSWQALPPHRLLASNENTTASPAINDALFTLYQPRKNIVPMNPEKRAHLKRHFY